MRKLPVYILIAVLALGFAVRILDAGVSFFDDEPDWLVLVNSISFDKEFIHLPLSGSSHGPLGVYLTKLSSELFGKSKIGYRFILILTNTCLIWLMFLLTKRFLGEREGLFAAFLTAVNSYLIYYSREIGCDGYFLFFCMLVIYFFIKATETRRSHYMLLTGVFLGLALLNKLTFLIFIPGFAVYLLIDKERRIWFQRPSLYLSALISFVLISPYLYWLYEHQWNHIIINRHYFNFFNFPPVLPVVFLGSILKVGEYPSINSFGREYMSLGMGILLGIGIIFTLRKARHNNLIQLMHLIFWGMIGISILFWKGWPIHYNVCIIPAIVLAASFLNSIWKVHKLAKFLILFLGALHLLILPKYLTEIKKNYNYHSFLSTDSRHIPQNVNLNVISSALIPIVDKYKPTLFVTPNPKWDTISSYLGAETGIKTLAPLPLIYDSVEFRADDWRNILIIDNNVIALSKYIIWARDNKNYHLQVNKEILHFKINDKHIALPVVIALLSVNEPGLFSNKTLNDIKVDDFIINSVKENSQ